MKKLNEALRNVFTKLSNMPTEELIKEISNTPAGGIGASLVYAGAHEIFLPVRDDFHFAISFGSEKINFTSVAFVDVVQAADYEATDNLRESCALAA